MGQKFLIFVSKIKFHIYKAENEQNMLYLCNKVNQ